MLPTSDDPTDGSSSSQSTSTPAVRVIIRIRPLLPSDPEFSLSSACSPPSTPHIRSPTPRTILISRPHLPPGTPPSQFTFDRVFDSSTTQSTFFGKIGLPILESCLSGINATIFAYGQTGAGKTYTMTGPEDEPNPGIPVPGPVGDIPLYTDTAGSGSSDGVIPRLIRALWDGMHRITSETEVTEGLVTWKIRCSFLEIYKERLFDLLLKDPGTGSGTSGDIPPKLAIRECKIPSRRSRGRRSRRRSRGSSGSASGFGSQIFVENLTSRTCECADDALFYLNQGLELRRIGVTRMNVSSSRSHSVFTLEIERKLRKGLQPEIVDQARRASDAATALRNIHTAAGGETGGTTGGARGRPGGSGGKGVMTIVWKSKLHLVDLAGSERQVSSMTDGDTLQEACAINQSLSSLSNVIMSLGEVARRSRSSVKLAQHHHHVHVAYRDSKLTFLLKDSLGGNSKTVVIANISPSVAHVPETISTLLFAKRAKRIRNDPIVNENLRGDPEVLQAQLLQLRRKIVSLEERLRSGNENGNVDSVADSTGKWKLSSVDGEDGTGTVVDALRRLEAALVRSFERNKNLQESIHRYQVRQNSLLSVLDGKERLFHVCRMLIKFMESSLAEIEKRPPKLSFFRNRMVRHIEFTDDSHEDFYVVSKIDPEEDESRARTDVFQMDTLDRCEVMMRQLFHDESHPTVRLMASRILALEDKLRVFQEGGTGEDYVSYLDSLQANYEDRISDLIARKHQLEVVQAREHQEVVEKLSSENQELLAENEKLQALASELSALRQKYQQAELEYEIVAADMKTECGRKVDRVTSENLELQQMCQEVLDLLRQSIAQRRNSEQVNTTERTELEDRMKIAEERYTSVIGNIREEHQRRIAQVQQKTQQVVQKLTEVESEKTVLETNVQQLHRSYDEMKEQLTEQEQVTSLGESFLLSELGSVKVRLKESELRLSLAQEAAKTHFARASSLQSEIGVLRTRLDSIQPGSLDDGMQQARRLQEAQVTCQELNDLTSRQRLRITELERRCQFLETRQNGEDG